MSPALRGASTALLGIGSYVPSLRITNDALVDRIQSSDEWIHSRSGIRTRYWADTTETVEFMAAAAAERALKNAGVAAGDIGCVLVATVTYLRQLPSLAAVLAHRLGTGSPAAFDISAGCAGFCYGVSLASDMVAAGSARYVLVVAVERLTDLTDHDDRQTAFLFGDGAGAVVVGPSEEPGIGPVVWGSDGAQRDLIRQTVPWDALRDDPGARWPAITMSGRDVFRWASYELGPVAGQALDRAGVAVGDLDSFIPHQANLRITEQLAVELGLPDHVVVARSITEHGNTSAASIPLAMHELLASGAARPGGLALLLAFGTGLVWAGQVVRLPTPPVDPPLPATAPPPEPDRGGRS
ncbi:beta-ketoacyl-ACP synthase III [Actinosynnema sp. NPDC047251]|uniref:3-oxoacyl-[acyl-carrier-protein] synthase 3 protein 1 n=1 Tax=Saccharothrix espanaensis (strain ATCC 51144 / DSM 44229 / JCM 9112 / NBRC 15066 / NRRL 15764) TaxID=1179773 RepID=K0JVA6_SACES|nr:beta-ketoacyl-ACP synthase III [Saccharothrix espanaensis]CCH29442.1 3-oxoacyl-[acyl-carrier-protein] synthase 3 protein 1 [Saccharothrix espanaensis DSM 44229]